MPTDPSKYAENQFLSTTVEDLPLMGEIISTTVPRITAAAVDNVAFIPARDEIVTFDEDWTGAEVVRANAEAAQLGATLAFEDKMASLTRKPDAETNSPLETWDITIRGQVAYQGPTYVLLLPHGRETVTGGKLDEQLDALRALGVRLGEQTGKPVLVTLGGTVTAFANAAQALRDTQNTKKVAAADAREAMEELRKRAAAALYGMVGLGMSVYRETPLLVDTLFDVPLLRGPVQEIPAAPTTTLWVPATRTLSTTVLPEGATRLAAWRQGPGGMPELLAIGEREALAVVVPAEITFDSGDLYQLWLDARNSRGASEAGPKQNWTAP
jgi:hypothetical protein